MSHHDEVETGIALLEGLAKRNGCTLFYQRLDKRWIYYFKLGRGDRSVDFTLSEEFLADLPGTQQHQQHTTEAFGMFAKRLHSPLPNGFYSRSGTPFKVEFQWPLKKHPSRDVVWLHASVEDIRFPDLVAKTAPVIFGPLEEFEFKHRPFKRLEVIVNSLRISLDSSRLEFYSPGQHPSILQEITISDLPSVARVGETAIQQFLVAKVYWLAFKTGGKNALVWIADPWDAFYLGVSVNELMRASEILQARRLIRLSEYDGELALAEDALIALPVSNEPAQSNRPIGFAT